MLKYSLRQIEYFVTAAEAGSLSAAAQHHHVSATGISTALSQLERSLDIQLAIRHKGRGFQLSPAGVEFLEEARLFLHQARELEVTGKAHQGVLSGRVLIGCDALLSPFIFPALIDAVSIHHPQLQLELHEDLPHIVQHELLIGKLDLAFVNRRHMEPAIEGQLVQPADPYVIVPPGHFLESKGSITFVDLDEVPLILQDTPSVRNRLLPSMHKAGMTPKVRWGSQNLETVRSIVARGHGVSVLMQQPVTNVTYDGRVVVPIPLNERLEGGLGVYLTYPAQGHLSRRLRAIIEFFVHSEELRDFASRHP